MPKYNRRTVYRPLTTAEIQEMDQAGRQWSRTNLSRLAVGEPTTLSRAPLLPFNRQFDQRSSWPRFLTRQQVDGQVFRDSAMTKANSFGLISHQLLTQIFSDFQDMEVTQTGRGWENIGQFSLNRYEIYLRVAAVVHCTTNGRQFQKLLGSLDTTLEQMIQLGRSTTSTASSAFVTISHNTTVHGKLLNNSSFC